MSIYAFLPGTVPVADSYCKAETAVETGYFGLPMHPVLGCVFLALAEIVYENTTDYALIDYRLNGGQEPLKEAIKKRNCQL